MFVQKVCQLSLPHKTLQLHFSSSVVSISTLAPDSPVMYMKDGLHLSGKGAAVFADKLSAAVDSDLGTMTNIFGSKHSLN